MPSVAAQWAGKQCGTETVHEVRVSPRDLERLGHGVTAERLIEASFEFLLEREPKEAILRQFALPEIESYFPEYAKKMRDLLQERIAATSFFDCTR